MYSHIRVLHCSRDRLNAPNNRFVGVARMASASASASGTGIVGQPPILPGPARDERTRWRTRWRQRLREENKSLAKRIFARRPEVRLINDYELVQATVRKLATVVGYLSLTWSSVVLLGGFVTELQLADFWTITALSATFAFSLADLFEYKLASLYAACNVYIGLRDNLARRISWCSRGIVCLVVICSVIAETSLWVLLFGGFAMVQILSFAPSVGILVSSIRLVVISRHGSAFGHGGNTAKLKASLRIFYSLALVQNSLFFTWDLLRSSGPPRVLAVCQQWGFGKWGSRLVWRYLRETTNMCASQGALPRGRNLGTFALGLVGSELVDDHRDAVRMLDTFVGSAGSKKHEDEVGGGGGGLRWLHCSKDGIDKLIKTLEVGKNDGETRERAARIVVALAGDLRHIDHQFPTALDHIGSLLLQSTDAQSPGKFPTATETTRTSTEEDEVVGRKRRRNGPVYWCVLSLFNIFFYRRIFVNEPQKRQDRDEIIPAGEPKRLISQGLLIIEKLALHQENRVHICNNHVLLSKITAPLYSHAFLDAAAEYNSDWIEIQGRSLRIVASLTKTRGEAGRGLRNGIASNTQAISNLTGILEDDKFSTVLKTPAIDILAQLASSSHNSPTGFLLDIKRFNSRLWGFFLAGRDDGNTTEDEEQLRHKAGGALAHMLSVWDAAASSSDILEMFVPSTTPSVTKHNKDGGSNSEEVSTAALRHIVRQLTDMLIDKSKGRPRTIAARILGCLCPHLSTTEQRELPSQDVIEMLTKVLELILHIPCGENKLQMAVQVMICSPGETNNGTGVGATSKSSSIKDKEQQEEKDFLVALLSLAVAICDRMVEAHDFTCAAPQDMVSLVKKLKEIIQTNNTATVECLRTVKLTCQLVVSMVQLKPMCIKDFTEHNFKDVLSESLKILSDLDNCLMLFDVDDHHQVTKTDKLLVSLVKQAQELFDKAQEPCNVLA